MSHVKKTNATVTKKHRLKILLPDSEMRLLIGSGDNLSTSTYDMSSEVVCLVKNLLELLSPGEAKQHTVGKEKRAPLDEARIMAIRLQVECVQKYIPDAVRLYYEQLPLKIEEALHELTVEVIGQTFLQMNQEGIWDISSLNGYMKKLVDISERKKRKRLGITRGGRRAKRTKFNWDDIAHSLLLKNWEAVRPAWDRAKEMYKKTRKEEKWIKTIKSADDLSNLPEDLIERLGALDNYESSPAVISLEHAARLCGCDNNMYSSKQLERHLQKAKLKAQRKKQPLAIQVAVSYATS